MLSYKYACGHPWGGGFTNCSTSTKLDSLKKIVERIKELEMNREQEEEEEGSSSSMSSSSSPSFPYIPVVFQLFYPLLNTLHFISYTVFVHRFFKQLFRTYACARDNIYDVAPATQLIKYSPQREAICQKIKGSLPTESPGTGAGIRVLSPTRWTIRAVSLKSILHNYSVIKENWGKK